jgi:hypothetical protein
LTKLVWGDVGSRYYEAGVDRGVLYLDGQPGVAWNGLTSVTDNASGATAQPYYIDGEKYLNKLSREEFEATITAYTYPDEFGVCDGTAQIRPGLFLTKQKRQSFGMSYRTKIGNDQSSVYGYKIHLIYNAMATPSDHDHKSLTDSPGTDDFSWKLTSLPPTMDGYKRTSHIYFDSRTMDPTVLEALEYILYGDDSTSPRLPVLSEITDLIDNGASLTVTDNGDGTFTLQAPISDLAMLDDSIFQLSWNSVTDNGDGTWTASSSSL